MLQHHMGFKSCFMGCAKRLAQYEERGEHEENKLLTPYQNTLQTIPIVHLHSDKKPSGSPAACHVNQGH